MKIVRKPEEAGAEQPTRSSPESKSKTSKLSAVDAVELYRAMVKLRAIDDALRRLSVQGRIGTYTPMRGQEAAQAGAARALRASDWMTPTFRDHGLQVLRGEPLSDWLSFHMGFEEGSVNVERNLPIAAPVASQLPHAVGLAWAAALDGERVAVLGLLGDGATSKGDFHEALNVAGVMQLPVVFFCQNNGFALSTPVAKQTRTASLAEKSMAYGVPGISVDGGDVEAVYSVVVRALERARAGDGPTFVEAIVERLGPHAMTDKPSLYRDEPPESADPLPRARQMLIDRGVWNEEEEKQYAKALRDEIRGAVERAEARKKDLRSRTQDAFAHLYAAPPEEIRKQARVAAHHGLTEPPIRITRAAAPLPAPGAAQSMTMAEALNLALGEILEEDPDALLVGQDIGRLGGVFRVSRGLLERFGEQRVVDTPIAETGITGAAIGLAIAGKHPICEIQFAGFTYAALDQLISHAGRFRTRTRGRQTVPLVVRSPYGAGIGAPESHSDSVEALFAGIPGIKVVVASGPRTARALLRAAHRDPDPVVLFEPIRLYRTVREAVPEQSDELELGRARRVRDGTDITIVSYGAMLAESLLAANALSAEGVEAEVIDLLTLSPLDSDAVAESVSRTGALLVVHEGRRTGDVGAELVARLHAGLGGAVFRFERVCGWDVPLPHHGRDKEFVPDAARIQAAVIDLLGTEDGEH